MEDLVRVRVPDAAERARVGERALERVILALQRGGEGVAVDLEGLEAAGGERLQTGLADNEVECGAALGAGFGEPEEAGIEGEHCEQIATAELGRGGVPMQPAGDHQMEDEPEVAVETDRDALAEAVDVSHHTTLTGGNRRVGGTHQEQRANRDTLERMAEDARTQRFDIDGDVR